MKMHSIIDIRRNVCVGHFNKLIWNKRKNEPVIFVHENDYPFPVKVNIGLLKSQNKLIKFIIHQ